MTAVANPPSFQQINRSAWGANGGQGGLNSMNDAEVARMFMPRKSAQRVNSSSSITSNSSSNSASTSSVSSSLSTATLSQSTPQTNGGSMPASSDVGTWTATAARKKPQKAGPWPSNKSEPTAAVSTPRPQSAFATNGTPAASPMSSIQQPSPVVPSQNLQLSSQQQNGTRVTSSPTTDGNPVLYLLSMNGTFERKTITVPYYPESARIGRQTNAKTVPTPSNGFFDSKVLSRQHAEIWADRTGKIWIRDVRSSNGTFVNGSRLSAENRDSEPHELQSQDHLELGIDIVSEDQKTVVHHKVAAKVEYAGFLGASNNVLDMNFSDLDPANGALNFPPSPQVSVNGLPQTRGRGASQGSVASNGRFGPPASVASNMNAGPQRPVNFWLTPVTTEQIVKRLTHEMRTARLQTNDLTRTEHFFNTLLSKDELKETEKGSANEPGKPAQVNGGALPFKADGKPRFSDPPAPPPQQPLPEKPDVTRNHAFETGTPSLKRSTTERPRSVPNVPHERPEPSSQIISLIEALAVAKKEIDAQSARMRDLEEMLQKEREARETAEGLAKRLELELSAVKMNGFTKGGMDGSIIEEAFEPPSETGLQQSESSTNEIEQKPGVDSIEASTTKLQERLEIMMIEMREMKEHMESYRKRAEVAEAERDHDRKTLAEMVEKIRSDERAGRSNSTERSLSPSKDYKAAPKSFANDFNDVALGFEHSLQKGDTQADKLARKSVDLAIIDGHSGMALSRPPGSHEHILYHSAPYASMLGVVLIGMGLMAYMNGWQKVER